MLPGFGSQVGKEEEEEGKMGEVENRERTGRREEVVKGIRSDEGRKKTKGRRIV